MGFTKDRVIEEMQTGLSLDCTTGKFVCDRRLEHPGLVDFYTDVATAADDGLNVYQATESARIAGAQAHERADSVRAAHSAHHPSSELVPS